MLDLLFNEGKFALEYLKNQNLSNSNATNTVATTTATTTATNANDISSVQPTYFSRSYYPDSEKLYVNSGKNTQGIMGQEISFLANLKSGNNGEVANASFFWSFGDGAFAKGKSHSDRSTKP